GEFSLDADQPIWRDLVVVARLHTTEHAARVGRNRGEAVGRVLAGRNTADMAADVESIPSVNWLHYWRGRASQIGSIGRRTKRNRHGTHSNYICDSQLTLHSGPSLSVPMRDEYYVDPSEKAVTALQQAVGFDFGLSV